MTCSDLSAYDFCLPPHLIAQYPPKQRDSSRLLVANGDIHPFTALPQLLSADDLLVFNSSKVMPARLYGKKSSGGKVEILLERLLDYSNCLVQIKASRPPRPPAHLHTAGGDFVVCGRQQMFYHLRAVGRNGRDASAGARFRRHGMMPLPPYIRRQPQAADSRRYQTVYAEQPGSVAAPTAGLHFSRRLLAALDSAGIRRTMLQLHIGAGTFTPLQPQQTHLHSEHYQIPPAAAAAIRRAKKNGQRLIAVGTTTLRALEAAACPRRIIRSGAGETNLFIRPGYRFLLTDALITNFHLPRSSLFMLVCAFGGRQRLQAAYRRAIANQLRFYSYGDAMLLTRR